MSPTTKNLKVLIEYYVREILSEQELTDDLDTSPSDSGGTDDLDLDLGGDDLDADTEAGTDDLDLDGGDGGLEGDTEGGADAGLDGDLGGDDLGMDFGSGGGGFGGLGGGGGGGGLGGDDLGGDSGGDSEDGSEEEDAEPEEDKIPDDPNQGVVDDVKSALEQTQNVQTLLNVAKSSIQKYFNSFEEASQVLTLMNQEQDPLIQDVAKRLQMFLTGF